MTWTLHLPFDLKSKNRAEFAQGKRAVAGMYKRLRNAQTATLLMVAQSAGIPLARFVGQYNGDPKTEAARVPFRRVTIVRLWGKGCRAYDDDGFIAGCASLRDACQRERHHRGKYMPGAGIVWDDSAKWSEWRYEQRKSEDGKPGALLIVEDVTEAKEQG